MKYAAAGTAPENPKDFRVWVLAEMRRLTDAMSELESDTVLLKQWNAVPDKLYNGLVAYADGSNWNPGSGEGFYGYYAAAWHSLG